MKGVCYTAVGLRPYCEKPLADATSTTVKGFRRGGSQKDRPQALDAREARPSARGIREDRPQQLVGGKRMTTNSALFWELFESTGSVTAYILYRQVLAEPET